MGWYGNGNLGEGLKLKAFLLTFSTVTTMKGRFTHQSQSRGVEL